LVAAKEVADFLGTAHYEYNFTVEEAIDAVKDVVYFIESFE
jgi:asparagine synthase (glutamine-hydrolysing)